jgi:hypothetical protein
MWRLTFALLAIALVALMAPVAMQAQSEGTQWESNPCLARIPVDSMRRVPVYLAAEANDSATRALLPNVSVLTQTVALRARALLGMQSDVLPRGEPTITWRNAPTGAAMIAYRDDRLAWTASDSEGGPAFALLDRALLAVRSEGGPWFIWPDSTVDSLVFELNLRVPTVDRQHRAYFAAPVRNGVPVFSILEPWEDQVHVIRQPRPRYPVVLDDRRVEAVVVVEFVVDTTGHVDVGTIKDRWPADRPRLRGELGAYYRTFLRTVSSALEDARFEPARIGGCPVRQRARMPFVFKLGR